MKRALLILAVIAALPAGAIAGRRDLSPANPRPAYCDSGYHAKVYFETNQAELSDSSAAAIVDLQTKWIATCRPKRVMIAGFIDRNERKSVARARAETIKREFQKRGVAAGLLHVDAPGAVNFLQPPPDVHNRRVEITFDYHAA